MNTSSELTEHYVIKLRALIESAQFRAIQAGGSAIWHLEHAAHVNDLRAYVEALCRYKELPQFKARTKRQLAEFALRNADQLSEARK
jgi:hypothetical protein